MRGCGGRERVMTGEYAEINCIMDQNVTIKTNIIYKMLIKSLKLE